MLHIIRDRAQGWVAWFIVGLISIPFALWGVNSYMTGPSDVVVAKVNGDNITQNELQQAISRYREQMRSMLGDDFDPSMFEGANVRSTILDSLIEQRLVQETTRSLGQTVDDAAVARIIRSNPAFHRDGVFDPDLYSMMLLRAGFSPAGYEAQLRSEILTEQLSQSIQNSTIVTEQEMNHLLALDMQTREIAFGVLRAQDYLDEVEVAEDDIRTYYQVNQSMYTAPEQISVEYLQLDISVVMADIDVDEAQLRGYYLDNRNQFSGPEQRRASHILIESSPAEAQAIVEEIMAKLESGEDFATLAQTYSADSISAASGGDLGFFQMGIMDPEFDEAVFALANIGDISEPVTTEYGVHLIKLTDIERAEQVEFEDVREEVETMYRRQQADLRFFEMAETLANLTYEHPESLDTAANALGLEIQTSELFTRNGGSGIAENAAVVQAAFSDDVVNHNLNSTVVEISDTHYVVVRKDRLIPATALPFESVAPAIEEQLRFEQASDKARDHGLLKLSQLEGGADPQSLFLEANWQESQTYSRDNTDISVQILNRAFGMPKVTDRPRFSGFTANNGNFIVIKLTAVNDGDPSTASEEQRDGLLAHLHRLNANAEVQAFIDSLKASAKIRIYNQRLAEEQF
ncbi:peptidyl-prolyl cis-trans isomerase ppiD [Methylophaga lonarensis MPL]|uniref:Periplasmic chaperone PpiD n=1 Tax=Methylophaga lonarensis MPL TaxID=1286106 RepID=M7PSN9_9GAMM|nr:SurA N-terminal domain-containing protein [Methylophaga lonarensis]EMR13469.1 peptidyl-prolyl cis-trans isomerase ppiD [Methylophaga lonarensis MPL]